MKYFLQVIISLSLALIICIGSSQLFDKLRSHKPQYKAGQYYEYVTTGNEFEESKLLEFGEILKVGKDYYLLHNLYYQNTFTEPIEYFDKYYKVVTAEQLLRDVKEKK